ncbi:uncharacterized protein A4U43_C01F30690 [Asparagus officinalis]|uniref:Leucine-rich repeat-containing N-terminal plant-type domain-containing protein n=1 Tax=Asparagus officinalis TaxID=4686 RepID=A0A5P1FV70_ASPOF|nr:uncharacterized protein A4U43_C01F30690 [Asparagus officinalis]
MAKFPHSLLIILLFHLHPSTSLNPTETQALFDIRSSLRGLPGSTFFSSWDSSPSADPCTSFSGIICSPDPSDSTLRVTALTLGTGLENSPGLEGPFPTSISNLTSLTELVINPGRISGPIPESVGLQCRRLRLISISNNLISGPIPASLAGLTELHTLDLSHNQLTGPVPVALLTALPSLKVAVLGYNNLSGALPASMSRSSMLHLDLARNSLSGFLPSLLPTSLRYLSVGSNSLYGPVGAAFSAGLPNLTYIDLSMNKFSGQVPTAIFALPELLTILLHRNNFSGPLILPERVPSSCSPSTTEPNSIEPAPCPAWPLASEPVPNSNRFVARVRAELWREGVRRQHEQFTAQHNFSEARVPERGAGPPARVGWRCVWRTLHGSAGGARFCVRGSRSSEARPREQCPNDGD